MRKIRFFFWKQTAVLLYITVATVACGVADLPNMSESDFDATTVSSQSDAPSSQAADLVFHNGAIYTVNPAQPWAEAVAILDGVIVFVGDDVAVEQWIGTETQVVDLNGRMLMPGFQDAHLHALEAGVNQNLCLFEDEAPYERYIREIRACANAQTESEWVLGAGVNMAGLLTKDRLPIDVLDEAVPDRPVFILDDLGHGGWANSLAMELAGYDQIEGNPAGGIIGRDAATGRLNGVVLENAQQGLRTAAFAPTPENLDRAYEGLLEALEELAANGITTVSDAGGYWPRGHVEVWERAEVENSLTVRASNSLYLFPDFQFDQQLEALEALYSNDPERLLRFNQVKIYVDGILGQGTSAVHEPFADSFGLPDIPPNGFLYFDVETLNAYATALDAAGFQFHIHVTGDRGATLGLDAIEMATAVNNTQDRRHRLTHLYLVDEADWLRFNALGAVADFQLAPSSTDGLYADYIGHYIGDRANELLPAFELLNSGATVTISSDWDADVLSPFEKLQSILYLEWENVPELDTLIRMMTLDVAYLLHHEDTTGSIEVGKYADLIVLDRNLFEVSLREMGDTAVLLTLLEGEVVYQDPTFVFNE